MASTSNARGKKKLSTNDVVTAVLADSDTGEEYFDSDFSSSDNKDFSLVEEIELGDVESKKEEQVWANVVAPVLASSSVTSNKRCRSRGGKAAQIFRVQIQQVKGKAKFKDIAPSKISKSEIEMAPRYLSLC